MPLLPAKATGYAVCLPSLLISRDKRQSRPKIWLARHRIPLIFFTVVIPGPVKDSELTIRIFNHGVKALHTLIEKAGWTIREQTYNASDIGPETLFAIDVAAHDMKQALIELEHSHPLGRLWDFDRLTAEGELLSRSDFALSTCRCLVCKRPAVKCARGKTHPLPGLLSHMEAFCGMSISSYITETPLLSPQCIARYCDLAWRAILTEVNLSPKPGLVDRYNCGAYKDMVLEDFHRSVAAIRSWLPRFVGFGACSADLPEVDVMTGLRPLEIACETAMLRATAGVNTHKGSIFSLGLRCAAIGRLHQQQQPVTAENLCHTAAAFCRGLTERELRRNNRQQTAVQRFYHQLGLTGACGEAEAGYPLVLRYALPHYQTLLAQGIDQELALLDTLQLLMACNGGYQRCRTRRRRRALLVAATGKNTVKQRRHTPTCRSHSSSLLQSVMRRPQFESGAVLIY